MLKPADFSRSQDQAATRAAFEIRRIKYEERMKHNTLLLTSASLLLLTISSGSLASVELGKGFSVIGQFDAAYRSADPDNGSSSQSVHTNEFQLDFDYNHESGLYGHIELESATGPDGEDKSRTEAMFIGPQLGKRRYKNRSLYQSVRL